MRKVCYCNHCGNKNPIELKKCQYCNKESKDRSILFIDYLLDETKDGIEGDIKDKFFEKIEYLIKKYLYGIVFSVTFISAIVVNVAIRAENPNIIVSESPVIVSKSYQSQRDLVQALETFMKEGNVNGVYSLLYQYHFPEEASRLGIEATSSELFNHIKNTAYKEAASYAYIPEEEGATWDTMDRYCKVREGTGCKQYIDVSSSKHKFYNTNVLMTFYSYNIENEFYQKGDQVFMGKDDFDIYIVEVDGKYYLADIFDNHFDPNIESVKGDISKLDYETQMDIYVGKPSEEE